MYSDEEFNNVKYKDKLTIKCTGCGKIVKRSKVAIMNSLNNGIINLFCTPKCASKNSTAREHSIQKICEHCKVPIIVRPAQIKKSKSQRFFCTKSCAGSYNNTHKTHGTRRSKLEIWLEQQLTILYPTFEIQYNRKDTINSELDIYIPPLKLAFELNGIYHYESIHKKELLEKIQNNDNRKFQACLEKQIELCIINTSSQKYFKANTSKIFLDIIIKTIKLAESRLLENQSN